MFPKTRLNYKKIPQNLTRVCSSIKTTNHETQPIKIPPEPTNCCMSGCANCVWIEYAETISKLFQDGGEKAKKLILDQIQDPNMRAYLATELRNLDRLKQNQSDTVTNSNNKDI